ncbi:triose-phosphate isomerase [Candidatus Kaiserbacteria bacterium]|nr:triose-phosphate isomerase [Candidatus Kaiserbacteria bacterium]
MLFVLNWKMYPDTLAEAKAVFETIKKASARASGIDTIVAPPAFFLHTFAGDYKGRSIVFAAQNIHAEAHGAFTGDVSAVQAKSVGASYAIIGHAERRKIGETDDDVRKKVASAFAAGLGPIICIGESVRDHEGSHLDTIKQQLTAALTDVPKTLAKRIIIAYEPVWAIGAEKPMDARTMHEMTIFIRKLLWEKYEKIALQIPILYGGAILNEESAVAMVKESEVNGFLFGRMSVDREKLPALYDALSKI